MLNNSTINIDLDAYRGNIRKIGSLAPGAMLLAVVKADAYGHGALECARAAVEGGATWLGVAFADEGMELRESGITAPILAMASEPHDSLAMLIKNDITITLTSFEMLEALEREMKKLIKTCRIHVKVDTGMGRVGVVPGDTAAVISRAKRISGLTVEGIYSHFHSADIDNVELNIGQIKIFSSILKELQEKGLRPPLAHMCNSAGTLRYSEAHHEMVRTGISSYGLQPFLRRENDLGLEPVLAWETKISFIKAVPAGFGVSYGRTYVTSKPAILATVPVGYSHGYPRGLSNKGRAIVNGKYVPITGRVCMDQTIFDVTDAGDVKLGDKLILIGRQGNAEITADELASLTETISHEITTGISGRIPRTFIKPS